MCAIVPSADYSAPLLAPFAALSSVLFDEGRGGRALEESVARCLLRDDFVDDTAASDDAL